MAYFLEKGLEKFIILGRIHGRVSYFLEECMTELQKWKNA
jgi:hypothetical protein